MAVIRGSKNDDSGTKMLNGTNSGDEIYGFAGNDTLVGYDGNDVLEGGTGADELFGSQGFDFASYKSSGQAVGIDLGSFRFGYGDAEGDSLYSIEGVIGSAFADSLWGDNGRNVLRGLAGDDFILGGEGDDKLEGGSGNDFLRADQGNDTLNGGSGNDTLQGGSGDDELQGGAGIDTADFYTFYISSGVTVDLAAGTASGSPAFGNDRLSGIENLFGTELADRFTGNDSANVLTGHSASDTLTGRGGADRFDYNGTTDSGPNTRDLILDFSRAQGDKIDLANIDAKIHAPANEAFSFIGQGQFTGEGQIRFYQEAGRTYVEANTDDGAPGPEMIIEIAGTISFQATDFVL